MSDLEDTIGEEITESEEKAFDAPDTERYCSLCGALTDSRTAPILTMGHYGEPRFLCPDCAAELDRATLSKDAGEAEAAIAALGEKLAHINEDYAASEELNHQLTAAVERAKQIRAGTYDFANDEAPDGGFDDIPDELRESEEDRELDRKEAESLAKFDKVAGYVLLAAIAVVVAILFCRFFLR